MKIKLFLTIAFSAIVLLGCKTAQVETRQLDRSQRPQPGPAPAINIPPADQFELDNGLKVIVVENDKLPRVTYNLRLIYDPVLEGEYKGYTSIAGQMLRNGTDGRSKEEIDDAIDFIGASLSTHARGFFASSLSRHNETLLELISDIILNPSFPENELNRLKNQTISGIATQKNDPSYMMGNLQRRVLFGNEHPYGEFQTEQTVENITLEKCKEFYNNYFRPNVAYLIIVGDVKTEDVKPQIEKYFGEWEKAEVPEAEYPAVEPPAQRIVSMIDRPNAVQSDLRVAYTVDLKPNDEDRIAASIMNTILGGGMFRLNENLRETHGYTYGVYSNLDRDKLAATFNISTSVGNDVTEGAIQEILNEMYRIVLEPVSEKELQTAKNYMTGTFALMLAEPRTVANFAFEIARYNLPEDYYVNYLKNLEAVTAEDIQRVAGRYIMPENSNLLVVGKADDVAGDIEKFAMEGEINFYNQNANPVLKGEAVEIPEGFTAENVLDLYFEAIGGKSKLEKIKDMKQVHTASMMGMDVKMEVYLMHPHYYLQKTFVAGTETIQLYDGQKITVSSPMGEQEFTEGPVFEMAKNQSQFMPELRYDELGIQTKLLSIENVDGQNAYRIELTYANGSKAYEYFDLESGLRVKTISDAGTIYYSDYKEFDGLMFPTKIKQEAGPQVIESFVQSVEINSGLSKDVFTIE